MCDVLIDYSWEFLNTNLWYFVDDMWRLVYAYATLYKIILLKLNQTDQDDEFERKIIKLCDLGENQCTLYTFTRFLNYQYGINLVNKIY